MIGNCEHMDLAHSIVQAAAVLHQHEKKSKRFRMELFFRFRYKHVLFIMPTDTTLFIEFRGMSFRWEKGSQSDIDFVIDFLCNEMTEDIKRKVAHDVRTNSYIPIRDPRYADICIEVSYEGQCKFHNVYSHLAPKDIIMYYIQLLQLVDDVQND